MSTKPSRLFGLSLASCLGLAPACIDGVAIAPDDEQGEPQLGETRTVELRFLRFDVRNFEQSLDLAALRQLPRKTLDELWLIDFDMTDSVEIVLDELAALGPEQAAELSAAARNMRKLLLMTPDNVALEGTKLEEMISLAGAVGLPPARVLADLMQAPSVTSRAISFDIVSEVFLELLLGSHPNAQFRQGPITPANPEGLYPIAPNSLPITLGDVVYNFETLPTRFGPVGEHPGFVIAATGIIEGEDAFRMHVKANLNALPYKGIDLSEGSVASVNSTASQIQTIFDFTDPDWLRIEGLKDTLEIAEMTVRIREHDQFIPGGTAREPLPDGNSPAWDLPDWEFERLIIEMAKRRTTQIASHCDEYELGTGVVAFEACVDPTGWTSLTTFTDIGNPPPPAYFWDILSEIAQVRLHDPAAPGEPPIAEGDADVEFTLRDIKIPLDEDEIFANIQANLASDPQALSDITVLLNNNSEGDADFYYYRPNNAGVDDDYLYFITPSDLRRDADGEAVRPYNYANPGFFADQNLAKKLSSTAEIDGDTTHEKLRISPGQTFYIEDDAARIYRILVAEKPQRSTLSLELTRVR